MSKITILLVIAFSFGSLSHSAEPLEPTGLKFVKISDNKNYWRNNGFVEMEGILILPTDQAKTNNIRVWLKIPDGEKLSVVKLPSQKYSLVYPPGTVADRVDSTNETIDDVRGARIDEDGQTIFHVYEHVPGEKYDWLSGYEWLRTDNLADQQAGEALIKLYFNSTSDPGEVRKFAKLNQCGACHTPNIEPPNVNPRSDYASDSRGFFQVMTVLEKQIVVRDHRDWDLNADNPFVSVWCGSERTYAEVKNGRRGYKCAGGVAPMGQLDVVKGMAHLDPHTMRMCDARKYLFQHMDDLARAAFATEFRDCGIW